MTMHPTLGSQKISRISLNYFSLSFLFSCRLRVLFIVLLNTCALIIIHTLPLVAVLE